MAMSTKLEVLSETVSKWHYISILYQLEMKDPTNTKFIILIHQPNSNYIVYLVKRDWLDFNVEFNVSIWDSGDPPTTDLKLHLKAVS